MSYIDYTWYTETFCGTAIPEDDFTRLADIASDVVLDLCYVTPTAEIIESEDFKKATAYEVELLNDQGGLDAILGRSEAAGAALSESLGDYSISAKSGSERSVGLLNGIPISSMTILLLKRLDLRARWAFREWYERKCRNGKS